MGNTKSTPVSSNPPTVESINTLWRQMTESAVDYAIRIGSALIEVKKECQRGSRKFGSMFATPYGPVDKSPDTFMFSQDTANKLMKIARNTALQNSEHARNLPGDWTAIYEISRLPPTQITKLIKDGSIRPDMGRDRARVIAVANMPRKPKVIEHKPTSTSTSTSIQPPPAPTPEPIPEAEPEVSTLNIGAMGNATAKVSKQSGESTEMAAAKTAFDELSEREAYAFIEWVLDCYSPASLEDFRGWVDARLEGHEAQS